MSATANRIANVKNAHFEARTELAAEAITVRMSGNADMQVHAEIRDILLALDKESTRLGVVEAIVDVTELYFMNSTCLSLLVRWINGVVQAHTYKIRFLTNPNLRWQKRSLRALQAMGGDVVTVD